MSLESRQSWSTSEYHRTRLLMLVLHLVILPQRVRSHARELQLGMCALRRSDGIRHSDVHLPRQACL